MGKGKGTPTRRCFGSRIFSPLIEFYGLHYKIGISFTNFLKRKIRVQLKFIFKDPLRYPNIGKKSVTNGFFKRYNFI